jgi:hypothetical protein
VGEEGGGRRREKGGAQGREIFATGKTTDNSSTEVITEERRDA